MLTIDEYQKINKFKDELHRHTTGDALFKSYRKCCSFLLSEIFGYEETIFGYICADRKMLTLNISTYGIEVNDAQRFLSEKNRNELLKISKDVFIVSKEKSCQSYFSTIFRLYGYKDMMMLFLRSESEYVGYICFLNKRRTFADRDIELLCCISDYITVDYKNYIEVYKLRNVNNLLLTQCHYYPIGMLVLKNFSSIYYANEYARKLLKEMGINTDEQFSAFFNDCILPKVRFSVTSCGCSQIVKIKPYRFSVVSMNPLAQIAPTQNKMFENQAFPDMFSLDDAMLFIYFCREESVLNESEADIKKYRFSKREKEIIELLLNGKKRADIAEELVISIHTVDSHLQNIYKKTGTVSMTGLVTKLTRK